MGKAGTSAEKLDEPSVLGSTLVALRLALQIAPTSCALMIAQRAFAAALGPLSLALMRLLVDQIPEAIATASYNVVVLLAVALVAAQVLSSGTNLISALCKVSFDRKIDEEVAAVMVGKFKRLEFACLEGPDKQDVINRVGPLLRGNITNEVDGALNVLSALISFVGVALVIAPVSAAAAVLLLALFAMMCLVSFKVEKKRFALRDWQSRDDRIFEYYGDMLSDKNSLFELRAFEARDWLVEKMEALGNEVVSERICLESSQGRWSVLGCVLSVSWMAYAIAAAATALASGGASVGSLVSVVASCRTVNSAESLLQGGLSAFASNALKVNYLERFLSFPESPPDCRQSPDQDTVASFEHVAFSYPQGDGSLVLEDVTFDITEGEHVALVGRNGAGKSTVVKLLAGLYNPTSGSIQVPNGNGGNNGNDSSEGNCGLRGRVSFVFQDFMRYDLDLRHNVALGSVDKLDDDEALTQALARSGFTYEGLSLDTPLGKIESSGVDLSGGQWQRLAIARALVSDSPLIVLDEPTASLDPLAECELYQSFGEAMKGRACLIISHRLASAQMCDRIIVLDEGRIVQEGSHDELMAQEGLYREMYRAQASWYQDDSEEEG